MFRQTDDIRKKRQFVFVEQGIVEKCTAVKYFKVSNVFLQLIKYEPYLNLFKLSLQISVHIL